MKTQDLIDELEEAYSKIDSLEKEIEQLRETLDGYSVSRKLEDLAKIKQSIKEGKVIR